MVRQYDGVKVFSATKFRDRESLGETVTNWISSRPELKVVDYKVRQSSDSEYHCLSILLFYVSEKLPTPDRRRGTRSRQHE